MKKYSLGTKLTNWSLLKESQTNNQTRYVIKRWVKIPHQKSKLERLSVKNYEHIRDNKPELKKFILRLNQNIPNEQRSREIIEIRHAFISPQLLDDYQKYLIAQIPSLNRAKYEFSLLKRFFLNFFINRLEMVNPIDWHRVHGTKWAEYLDSPETPASADAKLWIVEAANRFMGWLHEQRPTEAPPLRFEPLSRAKIKEIEAKRKMNGEIHIPKFIKDEDWFKIQKNLLSEIRSAVLLAYYYGLRRAETLGLKLKDVRTGYLSIERQLEFLPEPNKPLYGPLKGREFRKVPHWIIETSETYNLIEKIQLMHPDSLTDNWNKIMELLNLEYTIHDIRHTWITKMMRLQNSRDVQLAAGHKNITTTMKYSHDDRSMEDEVFKPKKEVS